jgi:hypothetical protein
MTTPNGNGTRAPMSPVGNAGTGTIGHAITNGITTAVVANNPELAPYALISVALLGGLMSGLANASRNVLAAGAGGWRSVLAHVGALLG